MPYINNYFVSFNVFVCCRSMQPVGPNPCKNAVRPALSSLRWRPKASSANAGAVRQIRISNLENVGIKLCNGGMTICVEKFWLFCQFCFFFLIFRYNVFLTALILCNFSYFLTYIENSTGNSFVVLGPITLSKF